MVARTISLVEIADSRGQPIRIDRAALVIHNVKVLGKHSLNGREYKPAAIAGATKLYEGIPVNFDHPDPRDPKALRKVADRAGWLQNVRVDEAGGLTGDLHYLKNDARTAKLLEAAERNPGLMGLSHNVDGDVQGERGKMIVERITRVRSVDIVADPATTRTLFEEMEATMPEDQVPAPAAEPMEAPTTSPAESVKAGFVEAAMAVLQDDAVKGGAAKLAALKPILTQWEKSVAALSGGEAKPAVAKEPAAPTTEGVLPTAALEPSLTALKAQNALLEAKLAANTALVAAGITPQPHFVDALARAPATQHPALMESWGHSAAPAGQPRSGPPAKPKEGKTEVTTHKQFSEAVLN